MRILVYPHDLNMGGSQTNAIELAAAVRDLGHECIIFGRPGVLLDRIEDLGLEFIESPRPSIRPTPWIVRKLQRVIRDRAVDVVHGYEWPPSVEAFMATQGNRQVKSLSTVMSMAVAPFLPHTMPLLVGTRQIAAHELALGRRNVDVLEPPVDLAHDQYPEAHLLAEFRARWSVANDRPVVVCVGRLANELKAEGLRTAIQVTRELHSSARFQLLLVGDGPIREELDRLAREVNEETGEASVVLTGEMADPRPAYAIADIALGMGGSALRAMAFGKPLIVQGERGFFKILEPTSVDEFLWQGWYGVGQGGGTRNMRTALTELIPDAGRRRELGAYSLQVVKQFSLERAANRMIEIYSAPSPSRSVARQAVDKARSYTGLVLYNARHQVGRVVGREALDDFNAQPVAAKERVSEQELSSDVEGPIVYFAGVEWDAVAGTDKQLAIELAKRASVVWVDPPRSMMQTYRSGNRVPQISTPVPNLTRLSVDVPPGNTRPFVRVASNRMAVARVRNFLLQSHTSPSAVVASTTEPMLHLLGKEISGKRVYFATDDFVAGAELWRRSGQYLHRARELNLASADLVLAVTSDLAQSLQRSKSVPVWFPNGTDVERYKNIDSISPSPEISLAGPIAIVVGQINERLDVDYLDAVQRAGICLLMVGPKTFRDQAAAARFDHLLGQSNVQWIDLVPPDRLPSLLRGAAVGLTPYSDSAFNRRSYPLKTVEYLAAGIPVVSTAALPVDGLDRRFVELCPTENSFVDAIRKAFDMCADRWSIQATVAEFDWSRRAQSFLELLRD